MEPAVALSFRMVKSFLERFMPPSTLSDLGDYFNHADKVLENLPNNQLSDWSNKVALLSRNQPQMNPLITEDVLNQVYSALLSDKQLNAVYRPRHDEETKSYTINPLGLVMVDKVIYLVGTLWKYRDIKQFALHRFESAEVSNDESIALYNFDLQKYIQQGQFEYLVQGDKTIKLKLAVSDEIAFHLSETPLSETQTIKLDKNTNRLILRAEVKNTQQLRWWLMSFGAEVEILAPSSVREEFKQSAKALVELYESSD
jgi:predicted DNA-binding transcriptional regulator YafY